MVLHRSFALALNIFFLQESLTTCKADIYLNVCKLTALKEQESQNFY